MLYNILVRLLSKEGAVANHKKDLLAGLTKARGRLQVRKPSDDVRRLLTRFTRTSFQEVTAIVEQLVESGEVRRDRHWRWIELTDSRPTAKPRSSGGSHVKAHVTASNRRESPQDIQPATSFVYSPTDPWHVTLTKALLCLQGAADPHGELKIGWSMRGLGGLLRSRMGVAPQAERTVKAIAHDLKRLGLCVNEEAGSSPRYFVDTTVKEVTEDMIEAANTKVERRPAAMPEKPAGSSPSENAGADQPKQQEPAAEAVADDEVAAFFEYFEGLRRTITSLEEQLRAVRDERDALITRNSTLEEEVQSLQADAANGRRLKELLTRFRADEQSQPRGEN